ncbi:SPOR domain-containing protein [Pseudomonas akapageensis]|uniref:SPOR domain-containing protein n=1 Tax=Pseudomonas akapageensis TaxID=2609961 RepID=UPI00140A7686
MRRLAVVMAVLALTGCGSDVEVAHKAVADKLQNPKSAKFTNVRTTDQGNICGQVKSKDASGVYGGYQSYAAIKNDGQFKVVFDPDGTNAEVRTLCGAGPISGEEHAAADQAAASWDVQIVSGSNMGALTDMTARLVEHGFVPVVVTRDGKPLVLIGPFTSKAEADDKKAQLMASQGIESVVVKHQE